MHLDDNLYNTHSGLATFALTFGNHLCKKEINISFVHTFYIAVVSAAGAPLRNGAYGELLLIIDKFKCPLGV